MAVFVTKVFQKFAEKARLKRESLLQAADEIVAGRAHADLGSGIYKHRIGRPDGGKSGGFRTIVVFKRGKHVFFVHGFAKNQKSSITSREHKALQKLSDVLLSLDGEAVGLAMAAGELKEVGTNDGPESFDP